MHMADALISPAVGGTMWALSAGLIGYCSKKVKNEMDDQKIPLMGVMGAFIFAAQMINFTIPVTGSSGHLGGGMILSILLGPHIAFLTMASVLTVQALFFADGGLLALGCNIFNLGFFPCFIAYPLIYKKITRENPTRNNIVSGSLIAAILGLQAGAFAVVVETVMSGISELPFSTFLMLMQPVHLAIGIVEGVTTAAVVIFIWKARPEILNAAASSVPIGGISIKNVLTGITVAAVITGGALSWFASSNPDGLEWAMFKTAGVEELESPHELHASLSKVQEKTAFLPDYGFKSDESELILNENKSTEENGTTAATTEDKKHQSSAWPAVDSGTSVSGLTGGLLTLTLAVAVGFILRHKKSNA
ncbi:MAG: energy-coupling factor ABC transporter permease [Desulfamplus sp.]|nr:energy-coupling factor ABC transporter permease [Desulfamplus sp.]